MFQFALPNQLLSFTGTTEFWGLAAAAVIGIGAVIYAIAAVSAALRQKKAPAVEDPEPDDFKSAPKADPASITQEALLKAQSTIASTPAPEREQPSLETPLEDVSNLRIQIQGEAEINLPMTVRISLENPDVSLTRVELIGESGAPVGRAECISVAPQVFTAELEGDTLRECFQKAKAVDGNGHRVLHLRTHLQLGSSTSDRYFTAHITQAVRQRRISADYFSVPVFILEGNT